MNSAILNKLLCHPQCLSCDKQAGWILATALSVLVCRVQRPNTEIPDYVLL